MALFKDKKYTLIIVFPFIKDSLSGAARRPVDPFYVANLNYSTPSQDTASI